LIGVKKGTDLRRLWVVLRVRLSIIAIATVHAI
jgi:hypothetical protein